MTDAAAKELADLRHAVQELAELVKALAVDHLVDRAGAAAILGVNVRTFDRYVMRGNAPKPVKGGRSPRWSSGEVARCRV